MIIDYNYKCLVETPGNTAPYTITHKNNKGFIYYPGEDDNGLMWPVVNFYTADGGLVGITLDAPSGSFNDLYWAQFKLDENSTTRTTDINLPLSAPSGVNNPLFFPIEYHSMVFNPDVSGTEELSNAPTIITVF